MNMDILNIRVHECPQCSKSWMEDCDSDDYPCFCPGCGAALPVGKTGTLTAKASKPIAHTVLPKRLWLRAGITLCLTDEEADQILRDDFAATQALKTALAEGRFHFKGDTYIPYGCVEEYNGTYDTDYEPGDIEFTL